MIFAIDNCLIVAGKLKFLGLWILPFIANKFQYAINGGSLAIDRRLQWSIPNLISNPVSHLALDANWNVLLESRDTILKLEIHCHKQWG